MGSQPKPFSPSRLGKYLLLDHLASGGMAELYLAKTVGAAGFEKIQAVKCIFPQYANNDDFRAMFEREAQICSQLQHANIVQIYDFIRVNENLILSMEYVDGKNVRQILAKAEKEHEKIPIPFGVYFVLEMCKGLDYAHKKKDPHNHEPLNIIHRDISPQNVMVSYEGAVKIVDFGIAKARNKADITRNGVVKGKFAYMSPEQAAGAEGVDHRSDIFATGIVLYELLTQERLFATDDDLQTLRRINECQIPKISRVNPQVPYELEKIVYKALAKEPENRFNSASEMASALQRVLAKNWEDVSPDAVGQWVRKLFAEDILAERRRRESQEQMARTMGQEALESVRDTLMPNDGEQTKVKNLGDTKIGQVSSIEAEARSGFMEQFKDRTSVTRPDDRIQTQPASRERTVVVDGPKTTIVSQPGSIEMNVTQASGIQTTTEPVHVPKRTPSRTAPGTAPAGVVRRRRSGGSGKRAMIIRAACIVALLGLGGVYFLNHRSTSSTKSGPDETCVDNPERCLATTPKQETVTSTPVQTVPKSETQEVERAPIPAPPPIQLDTGATPGMIPESEDPFRMEFLSAQVRGQLERQGPLSASSVAGHKVNVAVFPEGTTMEVDGQTVGTAPFVWVVPPSVSEGSTVTFRKMGYGTVKLSFGEMVKAVLDRRTTGTRNLSSAYYDYFFEYGLKKQELSYISIACTSCSSAVKVFLQREGHSDYRLVGTRVPLENLPVVAGRYRVRLVDEVLKKQKEEDITVQAGKRMPIFEFSLFK
jgi:serine/threonine protein kinase